MAKEGQDFVLIKRKIKPKNQKEHYIFYYRLKDEPRGKKTSTGCKTRKAAIEAVSEILEMKEKEKQKKEAEKQKAIDEANNIVSKKITLKEYIKKKRFYEWDYCPHIRNRRVEGKPITERYAKIQKQILDKYILKKAFFIHKPIVDITKPDVVKWRNEIALESRHSTNKALIMLKMIFRYAIEDNIIPYSQIQNIGKVNDKPEKEKGVFTKDELDKMFFNYTLKELKKFTNYQSVYPFPFENLTMKVMFLVAYTTGMRRGELVALKWNKIKKDNEGTHYIIINEAFKNNVFKDDVLGKPKWEKERITTIPEYTMLWIRFLYEEKYNNKNNVEDNDYIFTIEGTNKPISQAYWSKGFKYAMEKLHIDYEERNLTPHCFRHTLNTILIEQGVSGQKIRASLGWNDERIQQKYTHLKLEHIKEQSELLEKDIENSKERKRNKKDEKYKIKDAMKLFKNEKVIEKEKDIDDAIEKQEHLNHMKKYIQDELLWNDELYGITIDLTDEELLTMNTDDVDEYIEDLWFHIKQEEYF